MVRPHPIDVLVFDDVNLLDVAGPSQAFFSALVNGENAYSCRFCSIDGTNVQTSSGMEIRPAGKLNLEPGRDLLIPGGRGHAGAQENETIQTALHDFTAMPNRGRLISVCSGALVLAAAGVIDGHEATTHWTHAKDVTARFPKVHWRVDRLFVKSQAIYSSAGVSAGIDLALSIIEEDHGSAVSLATARELVVHLRRSGGQKQFSEILRAQEKLEPALAQLIGKVSATPAADWTIETMAAEAMMSPRSLHRRFTTELGNSPARFVELARLDCARAMLGVNTPLKQVAAASGFRNVQNMRRSFQRTFGVSVSDYAARFSSPHPD